MSGHRLLPSIEVARVILSRVLVLYVFLLLRGECGKPSVVDAWLQDIFNLLPNLNVEELVKSLAGKA